MPPEHGRMDDYRDHVLGRAGERAAKRWLIRRGWRILATGWRGAGGEIDIVAERRGILAACEVKTPTPRPSGPPSASAWPGPPWPTWGAIRCSRATPYGPTSSW